MKKWIWILAVAIFCLISFAIIHFFGTKPFLIFAGIIVAILAIAVIVLYVLGRKAEKKQAEQQKQMDAVSQTVSMYIIDMKMMKLRDAGLPKQVLESTPKYARGFKMPIVKGKVGVKPMNFICDDKVFKTLLPKQEVKAKISGIYITEARRVRGPVYVPPKKKEGFFTRLKGQLKGDKEEA
ncbi:MAG: hypothetical protein LUE29_04605 [Lachnospiraceae bacterium]|nr:hypothetical protein [Lachnospiraceae bacterium]